MHAARRAAPFLSLSRKLKGPMGASFFSLSAEDSLPDYWMLLQRTSRHIDTAWRHGSPGKTPPGDGQGQKGGRPVAMPPGFWLVPPTGLEPVAPGLGILCSIRLSYGGSVGRRGFVDPCGRPLNAVSHIHCFEGNVKLRGALVTDPGLVGMLEGRVCWSRPGTSGAPSRPFDSG